MAGFEVTPEEPATSDPDYVSEQDCVASDIDVVGFHPMREGADRIWVVSCKSWQSGFNPSTRIRLITEKRKISKREAWQPFRELAIKKWADSLQQPICRMARSIAYSRQGYLAGWLGFVSLSPGADDDAIVAERLANHKGDFSGRVS